jgi:hypothetical protein
MRGVDMLMAFPYILLALAIVAALGPGPDERADRGGRGQHPVLRAQHPRDHRGHRAARNSSMPRGWRASHARILLTEILPNVSR